MTAEVKEKTGWLRSKFVDREFGFQDWTIDGTPLRELVAYRNGQVEGDVTPIQNEWAGKGLAVASLSTLLGQDSGSRFDTKMPDGRVALLFCASCFDVGCGALTADLVRDGEFVEWRDIGWQRDYEPLNLEMQEAPVISLRFERVAYEELLRGLLIAEESR